MYVTGFSKSASSLLRQSHAVTFAEGILTISRLADIDIGDEFDFSISIKQLASSDVFFQ